MAEPDACPVCRTIAKMVPLGRTDCLGIDCPRCGFYYYFPALDSEIASKRLSRQHLLRAVSASLREQNNNGSKPVLDIAFVERAIATPEPTLIEKRDILLSECGRRTKEYDENVFQPFLPLVAVTWCDDERGVQSLADLLREEGLLKKGAASEFRLTAAGLNQIADKRNQVSSDVAFVAMSFDSNLKSVYDNGLYIGIRNAGYKSFRITDTTTSTG